MITIEPIISHDHPHARGCWPTAGPWPPPTAAARRTPSTRSSCATTARSSCTAAVRRSRGLGSRVRAARPGAGAAARAAAGRRGRRPGARAGARPGVRRGPQCRLAGRARLARDGRRLLRRGAAPRTAAERRRRLAAGGRPRGGRSPRAPTTWSCSPTCTCRRTRCGRCWRGRRAGVRDGGRLVVIGHHVDNHEQGCGGPSNHDGAARPGVDRTRARRLRGGARRPRSRTRRRRSTAAPAPRSTHWSSRESRPT